MIQPITQQILNLFEENGGSMYGGEEVTQLEHAIQCAQLARQNNASNELITACLLHDIGHLLHDLPDDASDNGIDDMHELLGNKFLQNYFKQAAVEPVKLHVQAKRYLCAVEQGYYESLSEPSKTSLSFQGGVMSQDEVLDFEQHLFYKDAVSLRRWDDLAKDPNLTSPAIDSFVDAIENALK